MSSRKDKFYLKLALNLAKQHEGLTRENPSVGCVIVKNNKILSLSKTSINGRPHAEANAIRLANKNDLAIICSFGAGYSVGNVIVKKIA